jgi:transcriptional regulator with XRE-family HTH domain
MLLLVNMKIRESTQSLKTQKKLAEYFNVSIGYLLGLEDFKESNESNKPTTDLSYLYNNIESYPDFLEMTHSIASYYHNKINEKN